MLIEFDGVRVEVDVPAERAWEVVRYAAGKCEDRPGDLAKPPAKGSRAAQIREVVAPILADGRFHPRRKLAAATRKTGLNPNNLDTALKGARFEKNTNVEGDPVYRDLEAHGGPDKEITVVGSLNGDGPHD